jgi:hypothetical protein
MAPLPKHAADTLWRQVDRIPTKGQPGDLRILPGTRIELVLLLEGATRNRNTATEIESLDAMIAMNVPEEVQEVNKRAHALKVQEAHSTSTGIAMKRFIDKEQSPRSEIDVTAVTAHFRITWARRENDFEKRLKVQYSRWNPESQRMIKRKWRY